MCTTTIPKRTAVGSIERALRSIFGNAGTTPRISSGVAIGATAFAAALGLATPVTRADTATTTAAVTSSTNPSDYGSPVTFTGWVSSAGNGKATGTVTFLDGATSFGSATLDIRGAGSPISAGNSHVCALTDAGGVKCWGNDYFYQLGFGDRTNQSIPGDVVGLSSGVVAVSAGYAHNVALTRDGGAKCWGMNREAECGSGRGDTYLASPADVSGLTSGVAAVAAGGFHTCALTTGGGAKCWGSNGYGEVGNGTTTDQPIPVDVTGLTSGVAAIAAGYTHTCAVTDAGGVLCWGRNNYGQLGDGSTMNSSTPVAVSGLTDVVAVGVGYAHSCALISGGGVKCWGGNWVNQLGDTTTATRPTPVAVAGLSSGVVHLAVGYYHNCVLMDGGGAKCWGYNNDGELGDGSTTTRSAPVPVTGLSSGGVALAGGGYHTCAVMDDGGAKCWGTNSSGELGNGTTTASTTPVDVSNLTALLQSRATTTTSALFAGSRSITAAYAGDASHGASTSPALTQTVVGIATTTALETSDASTLFGESVTFTATVGAESGAVAGSVDFTVDGTSIGNAAVASGVATLATTAVAVGSHTVVAIYGGDTSHAASTSSGLTQTVGKGATTTGLGAAPNPAPIGTAVTFTATVAAIAPASGSPTGTVAYAEGATPLGNAPLNGGTATFSTSSLGLGNHTVTATYPGDAGFTGSTSSSVDVSITLISTTTTLTPSPAAPVVGQTVTLTATVSGASSGSVTFYDSSTSLGSASLVSGTASIVTAALTVGDHSLSATFAGDATHAGSASAATTLTVHKGATTTSLSRDHASVLPGGSVTLTATVHAAGAAVGTPGGDVDFRDDGKVIGTATLTTDTASLTTTALTTGVHTIVAAYKGSGDFEVSNSAGSSVTVDPRVGAEFRVNTWTTGSQQLPAAATLKGGGFTVAWASQDQDGSGLGIYAQRYGPAGARNGTEFRINVTTAGSQSSPALVGTADGGFTVAWLGTTVSGGANGLWAQRRTATGTILGTDYRLDTTAGTVQSAPALASRASGGIVAAWISNQASGGSFDVFAQRVDGNGTKVGSELKVSTTTMAVLVSPPAIAELSGGGHVVVWASAPTSSDKAEIKGQRLAANGTKSGAEFPVATTIYARSEPSVAATRDGGFVVVWTSAGQDGSGKGIYGQRFGPGGGRYGVTFRVNSTVKSDQNEPSVWANPAGGFTVAWTSAAQDGSGKGVYARRFDAAGQPIDVEFRLNTTTANDQYQPALIVRTATDFFAAWTSKLQDGSAEGIYGQRLAIAP